ncbi:hypothetical protein TcWFU_008364 [Taenia crassiceps]|uniref:Prominin n=1 Tax=Taenia crassiceps TaxID=6207 RepID=A0ABR4Q2T5_9CEST
MPQPATHGPSALGHATTGVPRSFLPISHKITINCCCYKRRGSRGILTGLQMAVLRTNITNKQFILRIVYIAVLLLTLVFLAISIILVIVYISSTGLVVSYLATQPQVPAVGSQTPVSLPDGLQTAIWHASAFVNKGIAGARGLTKRTLDEFMSRTNARLHTEVSDTLQQLLAYLGAHNALEKGERAVKSLTTLYAYVSDVYANVAQLHNEAASLNNTLTGVGAACVEALGNGGNYSMAEQCGMLNASIAGIKSAISSTQSTVASIKPYVEGLNRTIAGLSRPLDEVRKGISKLQNLTHDIVKFLQSRLDLAQALDQIESFWNDTQSRADALLQQLNETVKLVETHLPKYVHSIRVGFHVVGGVFVVMLIIAALVATHLVYRSVRDRLFAHPSTVAFACTKSKWDNVVCGKSAVCCCSVLFIPLLLVFAAIVAVLLFLLTTVSSEGCIYLERESAVKMTDFVVNGYVARQWNPFIRSAVGGSAAFLNTSPPRNVLLALTRTCSHGAVQPPVGLLSALGYRTLVNVSKLVDSSEVANAISQGREGVVNQIQGLNISGLLSSGGEVEEFSRRLNETITGFTFTESVNATTPEGINMSAFDRVLEVARRLGRGGGGGDAAMANSSKVIKALEEASESARKLKMQVEKSRQFLRNLHSTRSGISGPLNELISAFAASRNAVEETKVKEEAERQYDKLAANLRHYIKVDGEATFMRLTRSLLPCEDAHAAYNAAIGVICGETGGVRLLLGLSYVLALNVLFLTLLYFALFSLAFCQALQIRMLSCAAGDDDFIHNYL